MKKNINCKICLEDKDTTIILEQFSTFLQLFLPILVV